jgi:peptidoglycan-associated lipoprotein
LSVSSNLHDGGRYGSGKGRTHLCNRFVIEGESQAWRKTLLTFAQMYLVWSSRRRQPPLSGQPAMQTASLTAAFARIAVVATPLAAALALAACASKPIEASAPALAPVVTATQTPVGAAPTSTQVAPSAATPLAAYLDPNSAISQQRSVYFAYDDSSFRAQDKAVVELQGRYLAQHPEVHVTVSGNTDERGGSEYNLALGQRRAQSVKSALGLLGVKDAQVEAVSYGKEKPKATGHDDAAWQQNRRADFLYPST